MSRLQASLSVISAQEPVAKLENPLQKRQKQRIAVKPPFGTAL